MTLVFTTATAGALQSVQLGLNEIASALVIGKTVGSVFTRPADASIFNLLEAEFDVRVLSIPSWLENVSFSRSTVLHGENMRPINGPVWMNGIQITSLEGLATFIVLCCRYTESVRSIEDILERLIRGDLTTIVHGGKFKSKLARVDLPRMAKPLLANFVRATMDSDADSLPARKAMEALGLLGLEIGASLKLNSTSALGSQKTINFIAELLGNEVQGRKIPEGDVLEPRIFNTMFMNVASIALAAWANGADVAVECLNQNGRRLIPQASKGSPGILARLWLCQPPEFITDPLRQADQAQSTKRDLREEYIVFGGELEVASNVARELGYSPPRGEEDKVLQLWKAGVQEGQSLTWVIRELQNNDDAVQVAPHVYFQLDDKRPIAEVSRAVDQLAIRLRHRDKRLAQIARAVANVIHKEYFYDGYEQYPDIDSAMDFVLIAMAIGSLQTLTSTPAIKNDAYALNTGCITLWGSGAQRQRTGELAEFIPRAFSRGHGLGHKDLLWSAALVWGGASYESQGLNVPGDQILGIVAPHCTVVLELIRDPINFARDGLRGKLISVCRGSVPMLPRDPASGFVQSSDLSRHGTASTILCDRDGASANDHLSSGLVITFEPDSSRGSASSVFCGWYGGDLVFELDPTAVFRNLLLRRLDNRDSGGVGEREAHSSSGDPLPGANQEWRHLSITELLDAKRYYAERGFLIFDVGVNPAWMIVCAGCAQRGTAIIQFGPLDIKSSRAAEGDTIIHYH